MDFLSVCLFQYFHHLGPPNIPNGTFCNFDEFTCKSGGVKCILRKWVCDCDWDCQDGSDEMDCGKKTFLDLKRISG